MKINFLDSIEEITKDDWDAVLKNKYPFLKYDFLKALETTKCVSAEQGWSPLHIVVSENKKIIAVMPLYIKTDSQGEFIFDWSWADAYYRNGLEYYPKLVSSIPFTPASGHNDQLFDFDTLEKSAIYCGVEVFRLSPISKDK